MSCQQCGDGEKLIGQAFSDEIFRIFAKSHPNIELRFTNANRALHNKVESEDKNH